MRSDSWSVPSVKDKFSLRFGDPIPPGDPLSLPWIRGELCSDAALVGELQIGEVAEEVIAWEEAMLFVLVIEFVNCVMACEKSGWESRAADRVAERAAFVPGSPNILVAVKLLSLMSLVSVVVAGPGESNVFAIPACGDRRVSPGEEAVEEEVRDGVHNMPPGVALVGVGYSVREVVVLGVPGVPVDTVVDASEVGENTGLCSMTGVVASILVPLSVL